MLESWLFTLTVNASKLEVAAGATGAAGAAGRACADTGAATMEATTLAPAKNVVARRFSGDGFA